MAKNIRILQTADEISKLSEKQSSASAHRHTWRNVFSSMPLPFMVSQHSHTYTKENLLQVEYNMRSCIHFSIHKMSKCD